MAIERYGSKTDVVVKLIMVFFISLLSFSVGTFVGKKFSDNQHRLSALEPSNNSIQANTATENRSIASVSPDVHDFKPSDALSDDEIAKLAEEFVTDEAETLGNQHGDHAAEASAKVASHETKDTAAMPTPVVEAPKAVKAEATAPAVTVKEVSKAAESLARGSLPVEKAAPQAATNRIPSSLPKEVANSAIGKFTVQIASYSKEEEAQQLSAKLKKEQGLSAFYVPAKVKSQNWYRVSVGLFTTQKEAQAYRNDLVARAKVESAIVVKIDNK